MSIKANNNGDACNSSDSCTGMSVEEVSARLKMALDERDRV